MKTRHEDFPAASIELSSMWSMEFYTENPDTICNEKRIEGDPLRLQRDA